MRRRRRALGDDLPIRAEINVTSLVDIAFVLLVIFVITAPILTGGVEVNLPTGDVRPLESEDKPFFVSVRRDGSVFVEETQMSIEQFKQTFPQLAEAGAFEKVFIRGDSLTQYGAIMHVVTAVAATGKDFAFVAIEEEPR